MLRGRTFVFGLSALALLYAAAVLVTAQRFKSEPDFSHVYVTALAMRTGQNPYTTDLGSLASGLNMDMGSWPRAGNTPTFILCAELLTLLSPNAAYWVWTALNCLGLTLALYLLLQDFGLRAGIVLSALAIFYQPLATHFMLAQTEILVLLLLSLTLCWSKRYPVGAGVALGLAILLRVFPLVMVGYLLERRKWHSLFSTGLTCVAGMALTFAFVGVPRTLAFSQVLGPISNQFARPINVSLGALVSRLFWLFPQARDLDLIRRIAIFLADLFILCLTVGASAKANADDARTFGLWVVAMVLITPTAWTFYLVLLFLPFGVLAAAAKRDAASPRALWLGLASYALVQLTLMGTHKMLLGERVTNTLHEVTALWLLLAYASAYFLLIDAAPPALVGTDTVTLAEPGVIHRGDSYTKV